MLEFFFHPTKVQVIELTVFDWSLFEVWSNGHEGRKNYGFTFLPVKFWNHFFYERDPSLDKSCFNQTRRFCLGLGLFSFFFDY